VEKTSFLRSLCKLFPAGPLFFRIFPFPHRKGVAGGSKFLLFRNEVFLNVRGPPFAPIDPGRQRLGRRERWFSSFFFPGEDASNVDRSPTFSAFSMSLSEFSKGVLVSYSFGGAPSTPAVCAFFLSPLSPLLFERESVSQNHSRVAPNRSTPQIFLVGRPTLPPRCPSRFFPPCPSSAATVGGFHDPPVVRTGLPAPPRSLVPVSPPLWLLPSSRTLPLVSFVARLPGFQRAVVILLFFFPLSTPSTFGPSVLIRCFILWPSKLIFPSKALCCPSARRASRSTFLPSNLQLESHT